jgi:hypothetical protein
MEYDYNQWKSLDISAKADIINKIWNPWDPKLGETTRSNIVAEFIKSYPGIEQKSILIDMKVFNYIYFIAVIVKDSTTKVPKKFDIFPVNKGTIRTQLDDEIFVIDWRDSDGVKNKYRIKKNKIVEYLGYEENHKT